MTEKEKSKRFLIVYCIAIFVFAVSLILLAAYSQKRSEHEADRLLSAETSATDSKMRLDAVMTENARLKNEVLELTEAKEKAEKSLVASQKLSQILEYKLKRKNTAFRTAISAFETEGYYEYLSENDKKLYNSIK